MRRSYWPCLAALGIAEAATVSPPFQWNLTGLFGFTSPSDEALERYIDEAETMAKALGQFRDEVDQYPVEILDTYDRIERILSLPVRYLSSLSLISSDDDSLQGVQSKVGHRVSHIREAHLAFLDGALVGLDWNAVGKTYERRPKLHERWQFYTPYIDRLHSAKKHELDNTVATALQSRQLWTGGLSASMYHLAAVERATVNWTNPITNQTETKTITGLSQCFYDPDHRVRASCLKAQYEVLKEKISLEATLALNEISGEYISDSMLYNYHPEEHVRAKRSSASQLSSKSVNLMLETVAAHSQNISRRFFDLKKRLLRRQDDSLETFGWSDRVATSTVSEDIPMKFEWSEGVSMVRGAFERFDSQQGQSNFSYAVIFDRMLAEGRYEVGTEALSGGAFCDPTTPDVGPLVNVAWNGMISEVFTLAHETGHGIQYTFSDPMGSFLFDPPLNLAETSSIFSELLMGDYLLSSREGGSRSDKLFRLEIQLVRLDEIMNTLVRQAQFDRFEETLYKQRIDSGGDVLTVADVVDSWQKSLKAFYGDAFDDLSNSDYEWAHITHFFETPFYVYNYVWAQLVAGYLFSQRRDPRFNLVWRRILTSGNAHPAAVLLSDMGVDLDSEDFWKSAVRETLVKVVEDVERLTTDVGL